MDIFFPSRGGYMAPSKKSGPTAVKSGPKDVKPPDLWIHDMELKNLDKGNNGEATTMTVTPIPRNSQEIKNDSPPGMEMDRKRNSFIRKYRSSSSAVDKVKPGSILRLDKAKVLHHRGSPLPRGNHDLFALVTTYQHARILFFSCAFSMLSN